MVNHVGLDSSKALGDVTTDNHIRDFFRRPIRVFSFSWLESDTIGLKYNSAIWRDWANDQAIKFKLNNYSFFRGDLKVKIQLSASPFYYGLLQASYRPLPLFKGNTAPAVAGNQHLVLKSQRPKVLLNPQLGDTYTMTIPFIYPTNFVNIQSLSDVLNMGFLDFDIYSTLKSANGVSGTGITVTTYCWMDNIELIGASAGYAMQSDEYGEGVVSKPASWVANFANRFESIPVIGKFATATRIGASAVSSIASLFGFTNVPVVDPPQPVHPSSFPCLASSEIGYPTDKLTIDPKNELSVDPRIVGLPTGVDEMTINSLVTRESFLTRSAWSTADAVDTIKFSARVTPHWFADASISGATVMYHTPMSYFANLFRYWRGDIILTVRVISSKYHKGKLRISFDPSGNAATNNIIDNVNTTNVVQTAILDIGETNEVEFCIPYQQRTQFSRLSSSLTPVWSTSPTPTFAPDIGAENGLITVRVQNILTAPVASSSVDIMIYVRGANNLEFASPDDLDTTNVMSFFAPQSEEYTSNVLTDRIVLGNVNEVSDDQYLVHFGENILSLRQLLRRYTRLMREYWVTTGTANQSRKLLKTVLRLPMSPGYIGTGYFTANNIVGAGTSNYNYVEMTPLSYVSNAFLCYRGSVNYTFNIGSANDQKQIRTFRSSVAPATASFSVDNATVTTASQFARHGIQSGTSGAGGQTLTNQVTQAGVNVQFPMYTQYKFQSTDPGNANVGSGQDGSDIDSLTLSVDQIFPANLQSSATTVDTYVAAGTDFSLYFFVNAPVIYIYNTFPNTP